MNDATATNFDLAPPGQDQLRELAAALGADERRVLLEHGTEAPFCGVFLEEKRAGLYTCRLCGLPLFKGGAKFESGTGWPSFTTPFAAGHLSTISDTSYGMVRTEIVCGRCGGTRAMSSPTARRRPANAIASIRSRSTSRRRASRSPTNSAVARPKARRGTDDGRDRAPGQRNDSAIQRLNRLRIDSRRRR